MKQHTGALLVSLLLKRLGGCTFPFADFKSRHLKEPVRITSCQMSSQSPTVHQDQCALMPLHNACTMLALASATNSNISTISLLLEPTCRTSHCKPEKKRLKRRQKSWGEYLASVNLVRRDHSWWVQPERHEETGSMMFTSPPTAAAGAEPTVLFSGLSVYLHPRLRCPTSPLPSDHSCRILLAILFTFLLHDPPGASAIAKTVS